MPKRRQKRRTDLRRHANGRDCLVRLPGICTHDESTTVLAHIRRGNVAGIGQKPSDLCAVRACHACHDAVDARSNALPRGEVDGYLLEAICRQLAEYDREGVVTW